MAFRRDFFIKQLNQYCGCAFDFEEEFLANFWEYHNGDELVDFFIGDPVCRLSVLTNSGDTVTTTISTIEFLDWCDAILCRERC